MSVGLRALSLQIFQPRSTEIGGPRLEVRIMSSSDSSVLLDPPDLPSLAETQAVHEAARLLVDTVRQAGRRRQISANAYHVALGELARMRGHSLAYPLLAAGAGEGAWVQLADGRRVLDMVAGLGPTVFGHDDQDLLETAAIAAPAYDAFQIPDSHLISSRTS